MNISIVPIGNSKGIRLSKTIIKKYNITDSVEIELMEDYFIIKPKKNPRANWGNAFKKMHENGDDKLIFPDIFEDEVIE